MFYGRSMRICFISCFIVIAIQAEDDSLHSSGWNQTDESCLQDLCESHTDLNLTEVEITSTFAENGMPTVGISNEKGTSLQILNYFCPLGEACKDLPAHCLNCKFNYTCIYGDVIDVSCTAIPMCEGPKEFERTMKCQYCYQTAPEEHTCNATGYCNSPANPVQKYRSNCTVKENVLCLGQRKFFKNVRCNWTSGYKWSTTLLLSITLGGFGADRFYLGHWQEGIGKLFSFGGAGVWTLVDVILVAVGYLKPADGSVYI